MAQNADAVPAKAAPAKAAPAKPAGGFFARFNPQIDQTLSAKSIDLAVWTRRLKSLGLTIPIDAQGTVSGAVRVRVPVRKSTDPKAWQLDGSLSSDRLIVEGTPLEQLRVTLALRNGVLTLSDLSFRLPSVEGDEDPPNTPDATADGPRITGQGRVPISPLGDAELKLTVSKFDLARLAPYLPPRVECDGAVADDPTRDDPAPPRSSGSLTTRLKIAAPARRLTQLAAWNASGPFVVQSARFDQSPPVDAKGQLSLANGQVALDLQSLTTVGAIGRGTFSLQVAAPWTVAGKVSATLTDTQLLAAVGLKPRWLEAAGTLAIEGDVSGTLADRAIRFDGRTQSERLDLTIAGAPVGVSGGAAVTATPKDIRLSEVAIDTLGGALSGEVAIALPPDRCDPSQTPDSTIRFDLDDGDAAQIAATLTRMAGVPLPVSLDSLGGAVDTEGTVVVAKSRWGSRDAYAIEATAESGNLDWAGLTFGQFEAKASSQGATRDVAVSGTVAGGDLVATLAITPAKTAIEATAEGVSVETLGKLAQLVPQLQTHVDRFAGRPLDGTLDLSISGDRTPSDPWQGEASLTSERLAWGEFAFESLQAKAAAQGARRELDVSGSLAGGDVAATFATTPDGTLVTATVDDLAVEVVEALGRAVTSAASRDRSRADSPLAGRLSLSARAGHATGKPWQGEATVAASELVWAGESLGRVAAELVATDAAYWVRVDADALGGRFDGRAEWPRRADGSAADRTLRAQAKFESIDIARVEPLLKQSVVGTAGGEVRFAVPLSVLRPTATTTAGESANDDESGSERSTLDLAAIIQQARFGLQVAVDDLVWTPKDRPPVQVDGIEVSLAQTESQFGGHLTGELLGGRANVALSRDTRPGDSGRPNASANPDALARNASPAPLRIQVEASSIAVAQLEELASVAMAADASSFRPPPPKWSGMVRVDLLAAVPVRAASASSGQAIDWANVDWAGATVAGPFRVSKLAYESKSITAKLGGNLAWSPESRSLTNLNGSIAGGQLTGSVALPVVRDEAGSARSTAFDGTASRWAVSLTSFDLSRVVGFIDAARAESVRGTGTLAVQGTTGASGDVTATGRLAAASLRVGPTRSSLRLGGVQLPFSLTYQAAADRAAVQLRGAQTTLSRGNVRGDAELAVRTVTTNPTLQLEADLSLRRVELSGLTASKPPVDGRVSGRVTARASNLRRMNDLSGAVNLTLADPTAARGSFATALSPYLGGSLTSFTSGRLDAVFANGTAGVRQATLSGPRLDVHATGRVGLNLDSPRGGQLDLDVLAATGRPEEGIGRSALVQRAITLAAPGVGLLIAANEAMRDRIVHLRVGGTTKSPQVRVDTLATAKEAGLRFLLRSAVGG